MSATNKNALIAHIASLNIVPKSGGREAAYAAICDQAKLQQALSDAASEANQMISFVKEAPDNPYGDDDEAIAGEILRRVNKQMKSNLPTKTGV